MPEPTATDSQPQGGASPGGSAPVGSGGIAAGKVACPGCGAANGGEEKFCGECGLRLWEPCIGCESVNSAARRFCGSCGEPLAERLQSLLDRCAEAQAKAEKLAKEGYFVQAIDLVAAIKFVEHSKLREPKQRFERLAERFKQQREQAAGDADRVLEETKELEASGHLREALRAAKQVPAALRGRELRGLHDSLEERIKLADRLRQEIKGALIAKSFAGVLEKAERLNELEPWDAAHRQLVQKLRQKQGKSNEKLAVRSLDETREFLKACEYRKAEGALAKVPLESLDEKSRDDFRNLREVVWLANQAARAPYLNDATLAVVDRLVARQGHDGRAKQLADSMRKRRQKAEREQPGRPIPWAQPRKGGEDGVTFEHTGCAALLADGLGKQGFAPAQFLPAFGLALQGIGKAEYVIDLAPPAKGVLGKLAAVGPKRAAKAAWGIDLGAHSLKAIRLSIDPAGAPKLEKSVLLVHDLSGAAPPASDAGVLLSAEAKKSLEAFLKENDLAGERVVVGLPGAQTLGRFFVVPYLSASKFAKLVEYECRARIPVDQRDVQSSHLEWEVPAADSQSVAQRRVALVAATNQHIEARTAAISAAKPARVEVTSNCLALANATQFDANALGIQEDEAYAVVSVGAQSSDVVVPGGGDLWFRGLYGGSTSFDRALVKHFGMKWSSAEKTRRKLDRAEWMYEVDEALEPEFRQLSESILRALQQHTIEARRKVTRVMICGGAADQFGLVRTLRASAAE